MPLDLLQEPLIRFNDNIIVTFISIRLRSICPQHTTPILFSSDDNIKLEDALVILWLYLYNL